MHHPSNGLAEKTLVKQKYELTNQSSPEGFLQWGGGAGAGAG